MPTKRQVLELLKRDELLAAADQFGLEVFDRRLRDPLIDVLAASMSSPPPAERRSARSLPTSLASG